MSEPLGQGVEEPENRHGAYPRLSEEQRARLRALGTVRAVQPGEVLFRDGNYYCFVRLLVGFVGFIVNPLASVHSTRGAR